MKTFVRDLASWPKLSRIDEAYHGGRIYATPDGKSYPSVTSITGLTNAKQIQEWRDRVGADKADQITKKAGRRGTIIHKLCEQYLLTDEAKPDMFDQEMFSTMRVELDKIDNIHCLETPLYSHLLEAAGTVDCIAEYDGKLSVIDFKTASKLKKKEYISHYFMQAAAYCTMFEEATNQYIDQLVLIIGVDNEPSAQIFTAQSDDLYHWILEFVRARKDYKYKTGR